MSIEYPTSRCGYCAPIAFSFREIISKLPVGEMHDPATRLTYHLYWSPSPPFLHFSIGLLIRGTTLLLSTESFGICSSNIQLLTV